jgi:PAS domain S-box-containing protein
MTQRRNSLKGFLIHIALPSTLAVILFIGTLFYIVVPAFEQAMMDRKREMIKELTNAATSILDKYHKDETDSLLTRQEAQKTAISRIQYLRYGDEQKDYFWITDTRPVMIMHPYRPELNGQNLSDYQDPHGKRLFVESVKLGEKEGHGYVDYMWQWKDDSTHIVPKLSYVNAFKPWGWIIGTGIYIEDVKSEIADITRKLTRISLLITLIIVLILLYVGRQSLRIEHQRRIAEGALQESKEKYQSLVEASTEGLAMSIQNRVTFANAVLLQMTGFDEEALLGKEIWEMFDAGAEQLSKMSEPTTTPHHSDPFEAALLRADGTMMEVLVNIAKVTFYGQDAVIFSMKDLSQDQDETIGLLENREMFKTLMNKLGMGVIRTTVDLKGKFLDANDRALNILGYKQLDELAGVNILELFVDVDDKKGFRQQLLRDGILRNQVLKLRKQNGQLIVVAISLVIMTDRQGYQFCDGLLEEIPARLPESAMDETVTSGYAAFSGLWYQPLKGFMKKPLLINYRETVQALAKKVSAAASDAALVVDEEDHLLGIITHADMASRVWSSADAGTAAVHRVMSSPVITASADCSIIEALALMRNNHIHHLPVPDDDGKPLGMVRFSDLAVLLYAMPAFSSLDVGNATSFAALGAYRERYIQSLLPLIRQSVDPHVIFRSLSTLSDAITHRIIAMVTETIGEPPVPYCFVSLGSDARVEQSLSTDQDNALIFQDVPLEDLPAVYQYFHAFSDRVCTALNEAGYQFCKGNVMAMNHEWCQPLSVWKAYFHKWINTANGKDLLDINIFFDIRAVHGEAGFVADLHKHIRQLTEANPAYLYHLTQNTLFLKPQVGFWGNILLETAGAPPETVNIKESIMPVVNFARIYALRHHAEVSGTTERLNFLLRNHVLKESSWENIVQAFEYLNRLRLKHQAFLISNTLKPDNLIDTKTLSELDKTIIKKVIANINHMLAKLSYDFKGSY